MKLNHLNSLSKGFNTLFSIQFYCKTLFFTYGLLKIFIKEFINSRERILVLKLSGSFPKAGIKYLSGFLIQVSAKASF